jgi:hypothetical protein
MSHKPNVVAAAGGFGTQIFNAASMKKKMLRFKLQKLNTNVKADLTTVERQKREQNEDLREKLELRKGILAKEQEEHAMQNASLQQNMDEVQIALAKLALVACAKATPQKREIKSREISKLMSRGRIVSVVKDPAPAFGTRSLDFGSTGDSWFKQLGDLANTGESFRPSKVAPDQSQLGPSAIPTSTTDKTIGQTISGMPPPLELPPISQKPFRVIQQA